MHVATFRSDGRRLATIGPDGELKVWDTALSREPALVTRIRPRRRILAAAWNPEATDLLATLSAGGTVSLWRIVDDRPPRPVWTVDKASAGASMLSWLLDGRHLACAGTDGEISVWDTDWGVCRTRIAGRGVPCLAVAPSLDGGLRMAFRDGLIALLSPHVPGRPLVTGALPAITAASWSATGSRLAVAGETGSMELLDDRLGVLCVPEGSFGLGPVLGWAGESVVVVTDRTAGALAAIDDAGRALWRAEVPRLPTSLSIAGGMIALGGPRTAPYLVGLDRGELLFAR
jgi:WD40 repeat protein